MPEAGQPGHQASVITGFGRLAPIWRIRRAGTWRAAATSPRVSPARRCVAARDGYECGQHERDQREEDDDDVKHLRVHGAGELMAVRDGGWRAEVGGQVLDAVQQVLTVVQPAPPPSSGGPGHRPPGVRCPMR